MRVSEFLRQYQISGEVPSAGGSDDGSGGGDTELAFWAGWLIGKRQSMTVELSDYKTISAKLDQARDMAIKAAEFIEQRTL